MPKTTLYNRVFKKLYCAIDFNVFRSIFSEENTIIIRFLVNLYDYGYCG